MRTGPPTVVVDVFESARPSAVHTAPASPQARPPASVTVKSFQALARFGVTVTVYRVPDPLTLAFPGATLNEAATGTLPAPGVSLSVRSKVNAVPSCSEGTFSNAAVSGAVGCCCCCCCACCRCCAACRVTVTR